MKTIRILRAVTQLTGIIFLMVLISKQTNSKDVFIIIGGIMVLAYFFAESIANLIVKKC